MLKQGTFIRKKFNRFVLGNIWGWLGYCINLMIDSLISGNQLGEVSLQAVSIVYPLFAVVYFFSYLIAPGSAILFGKRIGEFKQEEAYRIAGTGFVASTLLGMLLAVGLWLVKAPFLTYYECTGALYREASTYYNWLLLFAVISTIEAAINYMIVIDGESVLLTAGGVSGILVNVFLSILLSRFLGISGIGIASCCGLIAHIVSFSIHFLKKSNNVKFHFCLDIKTVGKSIALGSGIYMTYLYMAVVDIVMNKIIITTCGTTFLPAYSVVNLVFSICELYGSLNDASMGFISCFLGERNAHDMNLLFRTITRSTLLVAACLTAFFFFGAPLMPILYGLETPAIAKLSVITSRIMAFTALGFGICYLSTEISLCVEKPGQACFICFLFDVFSPLLLALLFGSLWGFVGIAVGMSLSTYAAIGLYALIRIPKHGKKGFPIYAEDFGAEGFSYDLSVTPKTIIELRDAVHEELNRHGYTVKHIDLLIEELFTRMMEKNTGKTVLAECTLLFDENHVRIITRDDGVLFNYVNENNKPESLNAHILNSLLPQINEKNYVLTTSLNRHGFYLEK